MSRMEGGGKGGGKGCTPCNGLFREALPEGVPFSGFRYMKGESFHKLNYIKGVRKSVILICN